jgi:hypothetical protein
MGLTSLGLWADEERRVQICLVEALEELISQGTVKADDGELVVSGKLRPFLIVQSRKLDGWTFHSEASVFAAETDEKPSGRPDFQLSRRDTDGNQIDYDIECKLVRIKRPNKDWNYCEHYVKDGIVDRFATGKYNSSLPSGSMIGYIQEGEPSPLLAAVNHNAKKANIPCLRATYGWRIKGVTHLNQFLSRKALKDFRLLHLWADLR